MEFRENGAPSDERAMHNLKTETDIFKGREAGEIADELRALNKQKAGSNTLYKRIDDLMRGK